MSAYVLNAVTAPDSYNPAQTLDPGVSLYKVTIDVSNQAIYWQAKKALDDTGSSGDWEAVENFMIPGSRAIYEEGMVGIRIRASILAANLPAGATQAMVTIRGVAR